MKKVLFAAMLAAALSACATVEDKNTYVLQPKNGNVAQLQRDLTQCQFETSQRHKAKDPQRDALVADCMVNQNGYAIALK